MAAPRTPAAGNPARIPADTAPTSPRIDIRRAADRTETRLTATGGQRISATEPAEILVWEMHADLVHA